MLIQPTAPHQNPKIALRSPSSRPGSARCIGGTTTLSSIYFWNGSCGVELSPSAHPLSFHMVARYVITLSPMLLFFRLIRQRPPRQQLETYHDRWSEWDRGGHLIWSERCPTRMPTRHEPGCLASLISLGFLTTRRWPSHCAVQKAWSFAWGLPGSTTRMEATVIYCFQVITA